MSYSEVVPVQYTSGIAFDVRLVADIKSNGAGTQNERHNIESCFGSKTLYPNVTGIHVVQMFCISANVLKSNGSM